MLDGVLPPLIRRMLDPAFYPHPVAKRVQLVETHISYVLLTGEYAYKVKKPVKLVFCDFSTLELRRRFCEQEVRLNRRGAPGMYLGVVPITGGVGNGGGLTLDGTGPAAEYAVKMRQFPDRSRVSDALALGAVAEADVVDLARAVSRYHDASLVLDSGESGVPDAIRQDLSDSFCQTQRYVGDLLEQEWSDGVRRFAEDFLTTHSADLWSRIDGGFVRECHGDLHLGNVCRWDGRTLLFDCVEFNDAFRRIDVYCDAAFAIMDFDARGFPELANAFTNEYAEQTGDWAGLRLLPLYLCRNAYVRAKVNSILLDACIPGSPDAAAARRDAVRYYELAWRYARPPRRHGRLVLMCGASGSGKSTIARHLARRWGAVHVRSDAVRKHLAGVPLNERAEASAYSARATDRTYERLLELGLSLASDGNVVILDARHPQSARRIAALDAAVRQGVTFRIVHCAAPDDVLHQRVSDRFAADTDVSDATADLLTGQLDEVEPFAAAECPHVLSVDSRRPPEELATEIDAWCATDPRLLRRLTLTAEA